MCMLLVSVSARVDQIVAVGSNGAPFTDGWLLLWFFVLHEPFSVSMCASLLCTLYCVY